MFSVVATTRNSSTTHRSRRTTREKRTVTWFWSCVVACLSVVVVRSRRILNSLILKSLIKMKTESGKCFCLYWIEFRLIVMSTNLGNREREKQRKRESKETGQRSSTRKRARARQKKQRRHFCWRNNMKYCSGGEKMRNASGHLGENERQWKKKWTRARKTFPP